MEQKEFYKGIIVTADFEEKTITLLIDGNFSVRVGEFYVISKEALQNFAESICKKQRENCSDAYVEKYEDQFEEVVHKAILNAEHPKIDKL